MKTKTVHAAAFALIVAGALGGASAAHADLVSGSIVGAEGHTSPSCRRVFLKKADGVVLTFRIPASSGGDGILSVALTALSTGRPVELAYTPGQTTGCGSEPGIDYVTILAG
jgi:hypothetical protein